MIADNASELAVAPTRGAAPPVFAGVIRHELSGPRITDGGIAQGLGAHLSQFGMVHLVLSGDELVERVDAASLAGRGGGHFPVAAKWRTAIARAGRPIVVANAAEGEPWSAKDATMLQLRPHLVLDGLAAAARAVGARETAIWIPEDEVVTLGALARALAERCLHGLDEPSPRVVRIRHHYLAGESSSVVRGLASGVSLPSFNAEPAAARGVSGRPTVIHNIETLARVALVARGHGGTPRQLLTVVTRQGRHVLDASPDDTIGHAIEAVWDLPPGVGGRRVTPTAVLLGGFGGAWVGWAEAAGLRANESAMRGDGRSLGAGVVGVLPEGACGLRQTSEICSFMAAASARHCGPCIFGLPEIARDMAALARSHADERAIARLERDAALVKGRGACHHPDGVAQLVLSALDVFHPDVDEHLRGSCSMQADHLPVPRSVGS